uniref:Uncharacterized protein n=1 Tax=Anguilla anguilla TaxID=7936 RepID=A0A0E9XXA3_ANGAN
MSHMKHSKIHQSVVNAIYNYMFNMCAIICIFFVLE